MGAMASQITSLMIVYWTVYSAADQRKHQISASLAFVRGIHWWPVNSQHKWPVTRKMFPFDDVIMHNCASTRILIYSLFLSSNTSGFLIINCLGNDLSPNRHQAIIWANVDLSLVRFIQKPKAQPRRIRIPMGRRTTHPANNIHIRVPSLRASRDGWAAHLAGIPSYLLM